MTPAAAVGRGDETAAEDAVSRCSSGRLSLDVWRRLPAQHGSRELHRTASLYIRRARHNERRNRRVALIEWLMVPATKLTWRRRGGDNSRRGRSVLACTARGTDRGQPDKMTARRTNDAPVPHGDDDVLAGEFPNWAFDDDGERRRSWRRLIRGYHGGAASLERGEASSGRRARPLDRPRPSWRPDAREKPHASRQYRTTWSRPTSSPSPTRWKLCDCSVHVCKIRGGGFRPSFLGAL